MTIDKMLRKKTLYELSNRKEVPARTQLDQFSHKIYLSFKTVARRKVKSQVVKKVPLTREIGKTLFAFKPKS